MDHSLIKLHKIYRNNLIIHSTFKEKKEREEKEKKMKKQCEWRSLSSCL